MTCHVSKRNAPNGATTSRCRHCADSTPNLGKPKREREVPTHLNDASMEGNDAHGDAASKPPSARTMPPPRSVRPLLADDHAKLLARETQIGPRKDPDCRPLRLLLSRQHHRGAPPHVHMP
jgi:hypothetical protein